MTSTYKRAYEIAHAAATDAANRQMRAAGRKAWSVDDYNAAVDEFDRLLPLTGLNLLPGQQDLINTDGSK